MTTGRGVTYGIPKGWAQRTADNGKGLVFQRSGATGNADMIRIHPCNLWLRILLSCALEWLVQ